MLQPKWKLKARAGLVLEKTMVRSSSSSPASSVLALTSLGKLRGRRCRTPRNRAHYVSFRRVPFAAPPTGERRFAPPAEPEPWAGTLDCSSKEASPCLQVRGKRENVFKCPTYVMN